ncbi:MAG: sulfite exporter TauE/SafE family protein [Pseudolabrys sp.]|nr:sulfite exporter TauE/SafE family protein [Pseudolabrys sp.]MBV9953628.1 sulfite exporter TauE/SafE family protein [Pseudolabrys sp.]
MFGVPISELLWLALLIVAGGVVTGILAGLFGIGGGGIIVPVLYEVFRILDVPADVRMQLCIGTSIAIIVPTTIRSYRAHMKAGVAAAEIVRKWTVPAIFGVCMGAGAAAFAPSSVFKFAFIFFAVVIGSKMLFGKDSWRLGNDLPKNPLMAAYGWLIGLTSALIGVSGGSISNLVLSLYGKPIHTAVATSAGVGVPITIVGTLTYALAGWPHLASLPPFSIGFVSLFGLVLMAPVSSFTAGYGARLAHKLSRRKLEIAFGVFLYAVALRFFASLIWPG